MGALVLTQTVAGAILFAAAWLLALLLRHRSAATRALIWSCAMIAVLALPLLAAVLPRLEVPVLPEASPVAGPSAEGVAPPVDRDPAAGREAISETTGKRGTRTSIVPPERSVDPAEASRGPQPATTGGRESRAAAPASGPGTGKVRYGLPLWTVLVSLGWAAGALLLLTQLGVGVVRVHGIERRAVAVRDPALRRSFVAALRRSGVRSHVELLETSELPVPATWHLRRACVLVPRQMRGWCAERQEAVLLHELAHVRRNDGRFQLLAQAVAALHWFDPFCWVALANLRREREQACDDAVLDAGVRASAYATHLLEIARASRRSAPASLPAISLLERPALGCRVRAILDPMTGRRSPDRRTTVSVIGLTLLLTLPLAAFQPVAAQEAPPAPPAARPATAPTPVPSSMPVRTPAAAAPTAVPTAPAPTAPQAPRPSVDDLVQMRIHGITPDYVKSMTDLLGRQLSIERLVTLKIHGTTPEFGREMMSIFGALDADDLVQMRIHGVTPELARQLRAEFGDLQVDDVVSTRIHGASPEYVRDMKGLLGADLTLSDLVQMRIHGLAVQDVRRIQELLPDEALDSDALVRMRIHGVTPELIQQFRDAGYEDLTAAELIKIRIHGLDKVMLRRDGER